MSNINISPYDLFHREEFTPSDLGGVNYDVFISAFTEAERVRVSYAEVSAVKKIWLVLPEYNFGADSLALLETPFFEGSEICDEAALVRRFWDEYESALLGKSVCVDITGFIRPTLMFLIRYFHHKGLRRFDLIYSEPGGYSQGEATQFASEEVSEVRTVEGYGGMHTPDTKNDVLVVGAGYDHHLINLVAQDKDHARKFKLFGFPSLRADMFQESLMKVSLSEEYIGAVSGENSSTRFAPANDPFVTAFELSKLVASLRDSNKLTNLYLSPLSTKPQAVGFALFFILECIGGPVSVIFPFCERYNQSTSVGISRIWKYSLEF